MKRPIRAFSRHHGQARVLSFESLENRQLLSVTSIVDGHLPIEQDCVKPIYSECSDMRLEQIGSSCRMSGKILGEPDSATGPYTHEIYVPETIDTPAFGKFGPEVDKLPEELGMKYGLPPEIDPSKLPGHGCPNGRDPQGDDAFDAWVWGNTMSDISNDLEAWNDATVDKVAEATGSGFVRARPFDPPSGDGGGSKDAGGKDTSGGSVDDSVEKDPVKDDSGSQSPVSKDPEPEGDDPDELRAELVDEVMTLYGRSATSPGGQSATGLPTDSTEEDGEGLGFRLMWESVPDPEGGGPDELLSPVASFGAGRGAASSDFGYPTPDDPDGPPPGPEFSPTELAGRTASETAAVAVSNGYASYTVPDDQVGPPRPEV